MFEENFFRKMEYEVSGRRSRLVSKCEFKKIFNNFVFISLRNILGVKRQ